MQLPNWNARDPASLLPVTAFPNSLIVEATRAISRYAGHQRVLEAMAIRLPLGQVLTRLVQSIEDALPGCLGAVMLVDESGTFMTSGAAPSLPPEYVEATNGAPIGPDGGSCGVAIQSRERVIVTNIETDPLWARYRHHALAHGLRACWSAPIIASDGNALGSFAIYFRTERGPTNADMHLLDDVVDVACIAIGQARAESSLRRSEAHYRAVVETAPSAIVGLSTMQTVVEWNQAAVALFGRTRDAMLGCEFSATCFGAVARAAFAQSFNASLDDGRPTSCETEITHADGSTRWALWSMSPVAEETAASRASAVLAIAQDITARIDAEAALRRSEQLLRHSQKMEAVGRLAGGIAHDFNNLLTVIHGNASLALQGATPGSAQTDALNEVRDAAARATSLTRQLLAFSRQEPVEPELLDVNVTVTEFRRMLGRLIGEHVQLETSLAPAPVVVRADRTNLEQLLLNLVLNARDSMPGGGTIAIETARVTLSPDAAAERELRAGTYVVLRVKDAGTGMDEETRARAFEPFFTTKPRGEGTGLGLATVYAIAERHEGAVEIDTRPGVGTTVSVWLPNVIAPANVERNSGEHAVVSGTGTVLIVEDEDAVRLLARRVLTAYGYRVLEASNGEDALTIWHTHKASIDVIVTDVVMPRLGGQGLVDQLRVDRPDLAVVFCSGYSDNMLMPVRDDDPHTAFLAKPFTLTALVERVSRLVAHRARALEVPGAR